MTMGGSNLRTVGVVVDRSQGVQEAPHASTQESHYTDTQSPQYSCAVRMFTTTAVDHIESKNGHGEERNRLQSGEDGTPPLPHRRSRKLPLLAQVTLNPPQATLWFDEVS